METYNRLPHILNRNIAKINRFSKEEINLTFSRKEYGFLRKRERVIFDKFIKEVESEDIDTILENYDFSKEDIKRIYLSSPYRKTYISKEWDQYFDLDSEFRAPAPKRRQTTVLRAILKRKGINPDEL